jgi:hypothetical protein
VGVSQTIPASLGQARLFKQAVYSSKLASSLEFSMVFSGWMNNKPKGFWSILRSRRTRRQRLPNINSGTLLTDTAEANLNAFKQGFETLAQTTDCRLENQLLQQNTDSNQLPEPTLEESFLWVDLLNDLHQNIRPPHVSDIPAISNCPPTLLEVNMAVTKLPNTAGGIDNIMAEQLKLGGPALVLLLHSLVGKCWHESKVPKQWLQGMVFPIYKKKGIPTEFANYRGITLQCIAYKVLDFIITKRLRLLVNFGNLVSEYQGGYTPGKSTTDWVYVLNLIIEYHLKNKLPLLICFFDTEKAFDVVWLQKLLNHLFYKNIRGKLWSLICYIYLNCESCVLVNGLISTFFKLMRGVRQGGVSSPLLYLLFINPLLEELGQSPLGISIFNLIIALLLFCDDTLGMSTTPEDFQLLINKVVAHATNWNYKLNLNKCSAMLINTDICTLTIGGTPLTIENEVKYLGVTFTTERTFTTHWQNILLAVNKTINSLNTAGVSARTFIPSNAAKLFFKIPQPKILYASEVIDPPDHRILQKLEKLRLRYFKRVLNCSITTANDFIMFEMQEIPIIDHMLIRSLTLYHRLQHLPSNMLVHKIYTLMSPQSTWMNRIQIGAKKYNINIQDLPKQISAWKNIIHTNIKHHWRTQQLTSISLSTQLIDFNLLQQPNPGINNYLRFFHPKSAKFVLRLRSGNNYLSYHQQRMENISADNRYCVLCLGNPETAQHHLITCTATSHLRQTLLNNITAITTPQLSTDIKNSLFELCLGQVPTALHKHQQWFEIRNDVFNLISQFILDSHQRRIDLLYM